MTDCIFCKIVSGKLPSTKLFEDGEVIVFKDIYPQAPVHWIIIPKKHVPEFLEAEDALVYHMMNVAKKIIRKEKIQGYRLVNNGKGAAVIDHLHIHILGKVDKARTL
jgi:histidine triad (HIT) family protein